MTGEENLRELTVAGEGPIHPIDPRMDREPAGSLLLARAAAIRNATREAVRQVAVPLAEQIGPAVVEQVERDLVPRSTDFVHHRRILAESRTDPSPQGALYRVEILVVLDLRVLNNELDRLRR